MARNAEVCVDMCAKVNEIGGIAVVGVGPAARAKVGRQRRPPLRVPYPSLRLRKSPVSSHTTMSVKRGIQKRESAGKREKKPGKAAYQPTSYDELMEGTLRFARMRLSRRVADLASRSCEAAVELEEKAERFGHGQKVRAGGSFAQWISADDERLDSGSAVL